MSSADHTYGGRYVVIDRAGSGGMAEVYRARDDLLGREVAVKVLSDRLSGDSTFVERFRREAQAAANLNHPNVVALYDFGADGSTYYIVMEYIDGRALGDVIKSEGPLMPERAAEIGIDVARALERAHAAGLVHRDIKPSNIMMSSSGQTKVTDFGIARALTGQNEQTVTQTGMVIGTAAYLSPEQAQGAPVDQRSDVYSLGCVLYEMLGGRPPFTGDTPLSVAYRHVRDTAEPPSRINPDVPRALDAIVMKALAKNPDNRYQSAAELREDLERFLSGQRVQATPLLDPEPTPTRVISETSAAPPPPTSSRRGLWILLTLLLLALLAGLAWWLLSGAEVEVPDVIGQSENEAVAEIEDLGLAAAVEKQHSDEPRGDVFDQDPDPGAMLEEGATVTIVVSSGPGKVSVPELTGLTEKEAQEELEEHDLKLGTRTKEFSETVEEGRIIEQSPAPDERVLPETEVDVVVSEGPAPVSVPNVIGATEDAAIAELDSAGFVVIVERGESEEYEEGLVFDQDPDPDSEAEAGSSVTIFVSEGGPPVEIPDVTGDPVAEAQSELEGLGLVVTTVEDVCDDSIEPNHVCDTDPPAGTEVEEGEEVTVIYQAPGGEEDNEGEGGGE